MNYEASNRKAALFLNVLLVVLEIYATIESIQANGFGGSLVYYTVISNLLTLVTSALFIWSSSVRERAIVELTTRSKPRNLTGAGSKSADAKLYDEVVGAADARYEKIRVLRFISVCMTTVTFLVVVLVLLPMHVHTLGPWYFLWTGAAKFHHVICPIVSFVSFIMLEPGKKLGRKEIGWALLPTLIYAVVFIALNAAGTITGPYPFLQVRDQSVGASIGWFVGILVGNAAIAWCIAKLNEKKAE